MRASTKTKLSLLDFAKILGVHPLHFAQVAYVRPDMPTPNCSQVYFQYSWQNGDAVSREEIARAIAEAEALVESYLKYRLVPTWEVDEWRPTEQPFRPELFRIGAYDIRGQNQIVKAKWGHFISGGIEAKTLIEAASAITWSDGDGDGDDDTGTVTVAVDSGQDPCEIAIYYPGKSGEDVWEIKPINVSVSGVTATITFPRQLAVLEALQESLAPDGVDWVDDSQFLSTVDVYRHWNDPQTQATLLWEPGSSCSCSSVSGCPVCSYSVQTACLHVREDSRLSLVAYSPAEWDADDEEFDPAPLLNWWEPDLVRLYYQAGLRDKSLSCMNEMTAEWKRTITYMAAALLDRPPCDCAQTDWEYWREDLALQEGSGGSQQQTSIYRMSFDDLDNPFGTRRGLLYAWRKVKNHGQVSIALA